MGFPLNLMNIQNPIMPTLAAPSGVDVVIESLRPRLANLPWMERCFGRAVALYEGEGANRVPKAPIGSETLKGKREYFSCMPNDAQKSFGWFKPFASMVPLDQDAPFQNSVMYEQKCYFYFWANLDRIDKDNLSLGEKLKGDVIALFQSSPGVSVIEVVSDDVKQVYEGWTLDLLGRDLLYHPYYAARFELNLNLKQSTC